jgi:UBX domain-containing protein 1/4
MTMIALGSDGALRDFLHQHKHAVVTFSAHWCGPCKASKPALVQLAEKYGAAGSAVKFAICYENDLGDAIHTYSIRAFPTHVLFASGTEVKRVEGANLAALDDMVRDIPVEPLTTGVGETLGGGSGGVAPLSHAAARAVRLAKLAGNTPTATTTNPAPMDKDDDVDDAKEAAVAAAKDHDGDTEMKDTAEDAEDAEAPKEDPTSKLDPALIQTLTESMGFSLIRAQKGLLYGNNNTVEGAVEWLMEHQDDVDIDAPNIALVKAQSYKCNDCGKILSNMANLELHANKTGHADFEESVIRLQPMTEEQKAAKIAEIKVRTMNSSSSRIDWTDTRTD